MTTNVVVLDEWDVKNIVNGHLMDPYIMVQIFDNYLKCQYGISHKDFEEIIKDKFPEKFI